ncbi:MAG: arylsulfatase [Acidimicrobiia bacterium]|nr:arylsulfatase [Acidimicrobiia bacterium]
MNQPSPPKPTTTAPLTTADATSERPEPPFRAGAPNVVVIVLDDTGFAQLGCYGADIATPAIDGLADDGVRLTNFHTTAVCSPTRACLLTGRNHHRVGVGMLPDLPMAFPGYTSRIPSSAGTMAEILRNEGYATFAVGKWHLTPRDQRSPSGPFENWPLGKGFEHYYGFLGGDANHWAPELVRDNSYVDPPRSPDEGYHLTEDLAEEAIARLRELRRNQPTRPFLLWWALGATHAPHHVTPEWVEPYRGQFDLGWDAWRVETLERQIRLGIMPTGTELPTPSEHVPRWDTLSAEHRRLYARMMEIYAGFLTHTDAQIARVLAALGDLGERENTIVVLLSDNGASGEAGPHGSVSEFRFAQGRDEDVELNLRLIDELGGPRTYNHYPWGWAEAGNTPVRRFKRYTFEGGVRDPCIVSWPAGLAGRGAIRHQYCHAIDLLPTLLDLAQVSAPDELAGVQQMSFDGVSLRSMLDDAAAPDPRTSQYYECWGSRAMFEGGWKVVTNHVNQLTHAERDLIEGSSDFATDHWHLFDTTNDPAENVDLGDEHPEIRDRLVARWYEEAERNGVLPLSDGVMDRIAHLFLPWPTGARRVTLRPGERVFEDNTPVLSNGFTITATLAQPLAPGAAGVLAEQGDYNGGWVWHATGDSLVFAVSFVSEYVTSLDVPLPAGATRLAVVGRPDGDAMELACVADGKTIGTGRLPHAWPGLWTPNSSASLLCGVGRPLPVCDGYDPTVPFDGALVELEVVADSGASFLEMAHQVETAFRNQ